MNGRPAEADWKVFRDHVEEWRDRYLLRRNQETTAILNEPELTPTERFWEAREKWEEIARILKDCLDPHSRSQMAMQLSLMYGHGMIQPADLGEFTDELREWILRLDVKPHT
jgi:hypothetical protein